MPKFWAQLRGKAMYKAKKSFLNSALGAVKKNSSIPESEEAKRLFKLGGYLTLKSTKTKRGK